MSRKRKNNSVNEILEKVSDKFDIPIGVAAGLPKIEISGCSSFLMENHQGILEYGTEEIDVGGGKVTVKVKGRELELRAMNARELHIAGQILSIEFIY